MNRTELQTEVIKKSMSDKAFRSELIKDPKAAIAKAFNMTIPDSMNIKIIEEEADIVSIVIPKITSELSDGELDSISGGGCTFNCYCHYDFF